MQTLHYYSTTTRPTRLAAKRTADDWKGDARLFVNRCQSRSLVKTKEEDQRIHSFSPST